MTRKYSSKGDSAGVDPFVVMTMPGTPYSLTNWDGFELVAPSTMDSPYQMADAVTLFLDTSQFADVDLEPVMSLESIESVVDRRRRIFFQQLAEDYDAIKADPDAWRDELEEEELWADADGDCIPDE
jgi:hypothetical protein